MSQWRTKDGRIILEGQHYTQFRHDIWDSQNGRCIRCGRAVLFDPEWFHVHHKNGRGMGGSKRNDIPSEVEGLCRNCHGKEHNQ